jgi:hypothetical protein
MLQTTLALAQAPAGADATPAIIPTTTTATTTPAAAEPALSAEQRFSRGKRSFEYRDCPGTILLLEDLAVPGQLDDEAQQLDVHRMLGICYALGEQRREASREFSSLLSLDPDHQLDPFEVPPPVMELFESQKQLMKTRLDELRRARERQKDDLEEGGVLVERITTVRETPLAAAFLPFGLAQLANGDVVKGTVIGSVQGVGLLVNIIGYWGSRVVVEQGLPDGYTQEEVNIENPFYFGHLIGLGTFLVGYGVGVADALWNREDQAIMASKATKRPLTPKELKNLRRIERAPDPAPEPIETPPPTTAPATPASATEPAASTPSP